jgi:plasmid stabilization system protein ParE
MSLPVTFRRAARAEFDEAHAWYEHQRPGLGDQFSERVQEVLDRIAATPEVHQCVYKDVRRSVVQGFPYSVLYRVKSDKIVVIAVFHGKRNPAIWQARA